MNKTYKYIGLLFQQRAEAVKTIQFVAAAEDIKDWGGVPSKSATYMKGFQRALIESHKNEISDYFEIDSKNISPTSVVVAFKPNAVKIEAIPGAESLVPKGSAAIPVILTITAPDENSAKIPELAKEAVKCLRGSFKDIGIEESEEDEEGEGEDGLPENESQEGNAENDDNAEASEAEEENGLSLGTSHLKKFITNLENQEWVKSRFIRRKCV